jgi:hypothetical protein
MRAMNYIVFAFRILSIPSALIALLIFSDSVITGCEMDRAIVSKKYVSIASSTEYYVAAKGNHSYYEAVSKDFYDRLNIGDHVIIRLTPVFKEWRSIELIREGVIVAKTRGTDMYYMSMMGVALLIPLFSFKSETYITSQLALLITIPLFEVITLLIIFKFFLVWMGVFDRV